MSPVRDRDKIMGDHNQKKGSKETVFTVTFGKGA